MTVTNNNILFHCNLYSLGIMLFLNFVCTICIIIMHPCSTSSLTLSLILNFYVIFMAGGMCYIITYCDPELYNQCSVAIIV